MDSRNGSSGFRIGENSKPSPTAFGFHASTIAPLGKKTAPKRVPGFAGVFASAVYAGTIASSSGRDTAAPMPRRNVRRAREVFVMNMVLRSLVRQGFRPAFGRHNRPEDLHRI